MIQTVARAIVGGAVWASLLTGVQAATLTVGVTPLKAAAQLAEEWIPLLDEVGRRAGVELRFRTAPSIDEYGERLGRGEYDVAYMNPYHYQIYSAHPGYRALARERDQPLEGVLLVRKDGPVKALKDLHGATVSFPTPLAFAASILTQAEMVNQGIRVQPRYVQSHDSVLKGVASGHFVAGGTILKVLLTAPADVAKDLKVLHKTEAYASHPFSAHPRVPAELVQKLQKALLSLHQDETGRRLLAVVAFKGFEPAQDSDYDTVRRLDLKTLIEAVH